MANHPIVHIEFPAKDREEAGQFFSDIFGWHVEQMPDWNYATFTAEGGPGGGFNPVDENNPAGAVLVYIETDDIDATLQKIEKAGGKTEAHKQEIPGSGWFAVFKDPSGNKIGLFTPYPNNA